VIRYTTTLGFGYQMIFETLNTKPQQQYHIISKHVNSVSLGFIEGAKDKKCGILSQCVGSSYLHVSYDVRRKFPKVVSRVFSKLDCML